MTTFSIAGHHIDVATAFSRLLYGDTDSEKSDGYPLHTLKYYDHGWRSPRDHNRQDTPRNAVTPTDLGRAAIFGAFRGWKTPVELLVA